MELSCVLISARNFYKKKKLPVVQKMSDVHITFASQFVMSYPRNDFSLGGAKTERLFSSDVKRGQNLETEAEARALRPRPRPEL